MKNKIKFLNISFNFKQHNTLTEYQIVEPPIKLNHSPDGKYLIRGSKRNHSKEYFVKNNIWYFILERTKDNGHYYCSGGEYLLFPNLSEKEWAVLNNIYPKLSPYWKRAVEGRNHFMNLRAIERRVKKSFLRIKKQYNKNEK